MRTLSRAALACAVILSCVSVGRAAVLTVSNNTDTVNGNTSNPDALNASPGPDGISLREAVTAANNAPGPHVINFAASLSGGTIALTSRLPAITRDGISIVGPVTGSNQPNLTIDPNAVTNGAPILIVASSITISGLRIALPTNGAFEFGTIQIGTQGTSPVDQGLLMPPLMSNIRISGCDFRFLAAPSPNARPDGLFIVVGGASGRTLSNVTIADNTFDGAFEAINMGLSGGAIAANFTGNQILDTLIVGNSFANSKASATSALELSISSGIGASKIARTRIVQNAFTGSFQGFVINHNNGATSNVIDDTLIARNQFAGNGIGVVLVAAVDSSSRNNTISNTRLINNVFDVMHTDGGTHGIALAMWDNQNGGSGNTVNGVSFMNNTVVSNGALSGPAFGIWSNSTGGISNVAVTNTIFWNGGPTQAVNGVDPSAVSNSVIQQNGFTGNGNITSDPMFVAQAGGNYRLQSTSPAKGVGSKNGAPFGDADCQARASSPAIGAYEGNSAPACSENLPVAAVLPASRSVQVGNPATAFATIINAGQGTAKSCGLLPATSVPAAFVFQTTNPATNALSGTANTPVDIAAGQAQTYVFALTPSGAAGPLDFALFYSCANLVETQAIVGVNTLLYSASSGPVPDLIAIGLTPSNDGVVRAAINGDGIFAIASANVGAAGTISARARLSSATIPASVLVCETNPSNAQCKQPPAASVTRTIAANENATWAVFVHGTGAQPFDPANARVFFEFLDGGQVVRGSTSAALVVQ